MLGYHTIVHPEAASRAYNVSLSHADKMRTYFDSTEDILLPDLVPCDARLFEYVRWTGDNNRLQEMDVDGEFKYTVRCHERWWLAPACRRNISKCIPLLTSGSYGWLIPSFMQRSAAYQERLKDSNFHSRQRDSNVYRAVLNVLMIAGFVIFAIAGGPHLNCDVP